MARRLPAVLFLLLCCLQWNSCAAVDILRTRSSKHRVRPAAFARNGGLHSLSNADRVYRTSTDLDLGIAIQDGDLTESWLNEWEATSQVRVRYQSEDGVEFGIIDDIKFEGTEQSRQGILQNVQVRGDSFYALQMTASCRCQGRGFPEVRISDVPSNEALHPALELNKLSMNVSMLFRTFQATSNVSISLIIDDARATDSCTLAGLKLVHFGLSRELTVPPQYKHKATASLSVVAFSKDDIKLVDLVNSFYPFVDRIQVFLSDYSSCPPILLADAKIAVQLPQNYTEYHDGAFFFHDTDDTDYRFHVTSDVRVNAGYVTSMIALLRSYNDAVVIGHDCAVIKQPVPRLQAQVIKLPTNYEGPAHQLSERALAFHRSAISFRRQNFEFPGMSGTWLAVLAQRQGVPMLCASTFDGLIRLEDVEVPRSVSPTTEVVSAAVFRSSWPMTAHVPVSTTRGRRLKVLFTVSSYNRLEYLRRCIDTFAKTRSSKYHWVVIIADDGSTDGTLEYLNKIHLPLEVHIIHGRGAGIARQSNKILQLASKIGYDIGFKVDDDVFFLKRGWDELYINAVRTTGKDHLIFFHQGYYKSVRRMYYSKCNCLNADGTIPEIARDVTQQLVAHVPYTKILGAFFTFTPRVVDAVGYLDETTFSVRQGHRDFSLRCCRAGFNNLSTPFDVAGSNDFIGIHYKDTQGGSSYVTTYDQSTPEYRWMMSGAEQMRRDAVLEEPRLRVEAAHILLSPEGADRFSMLPLSSQRLAKAAMHNKATLNATFDCVYVCMSSLPGQIPVDLAHAVSQNGQATHSANDSKSLLYFRDRLREVGLTALKFVDNRSEDGEPGIGVISNQAASQILIDATIKGYERILVLSSDAVLHRNAGSLFSDQYYEVPLDWRVLVFGAVQDDWSDEAVRWMSPLLYSSSTSSAFAVGLHMSAYPFLLAELESPDGVFNTMAMQSIQRDYPNHCFVVLPNLAVIELGDRQETSAIYEQYRWNMSDYNR